MVENGSLLQNRPILFQQSHQKKIAKKAAELSYCETFKHHGFSQKIISDLGSRFTSSFLNELTKELQIRFSLSTAFHPHIDGQSETAFGIIQKMLRHFVKKAQKDWHSYVRGLEFVYDSHTNATTNEEHLFRPS